MQLVLLGDPVAHSRSPEMHQAAMEAAGIEGSYVARRVDQAGMRAAAAEMRSGRLDGANITMPHKAAAFQLADRLADDARSAGSVNTWVGRDGTITGWSTDVEGVRRVWQRRQLPPHTPVVVLGSGGAAAAALVALRDRALTVRARSTAKAEALAARVGVAATVEPWDADTGEVVLVNCTPLGMHGEDLGLDVAACSGLVDMAYGREETPAVRRARRAGIPVADGIDLLSAQAEESFRLWTGQEPPPGLMERVARNVSRRS